MDISFEDESEFDVHHDLNQLESDILSIPSPTSQTRTKANCYSEPTRSMRQIT